MLHAVMIDTEEHSPEPPDLLARLAARGVRLVDSRRYLLLEVPPEVLADAAWPGLETAARRAGAALQNLAVLIAMSRRDTAPHELVERILALPAACLPVLIEALGGPARLVGLSRELASEAHLDLCFGAYLRALGYQVAHGLPETDEDDPEGPTGAPEELPAGLPPRSEGARELGAAC